MGGERMRWKEIHKRIIKRFAIFPVHINDEYRWLETVYIEQSYYFGKYGIGWYNVKFVEEKDYKEFRKEMRR